MTNDDRFADRLLADTYRNDEGVRLDYGDLERAVFVPERLFGRAQCLARAYDLHLLPAIDIYTKTRLDRAQCEVLLDEIVFVARVSNDELLRVHLARIQDVVASSVRLARCELCIEGP